MAEGGRARLRFGPRAQAPWWPWLVLLLALSTVFVFSHDRGSFYRSGHHGSISAKTMAVAANLAAEHRFLLFLRQYADPDAGLRYEPYARFPIGTYALVKLATWPFRADPDAALLAAQWLMLAFFVAAAAMAYLALCRILAHRWLALTATLLTFSSYLYLYYNDMVASEIPSLFGVLLTFHGMTAFVQDKRLRPLLVKACLALLLGWHVMAWLLAFIVFGLARALFRRRTPRPAAARRAPAATMSTVVRYLQLGAAALLFCASVMAFNLGAEYAALDGAVPFRRLPTVVSYLMRMGIDDAYVAQVDALRWRPFLQEQLAYIGGMAIPYAFRPIDGLAYADPRGAGLGLALAGVSLLGLAVLRPRVLIATLLCGGWFYVVPVRGSAGLHDLEAMFHVGVPLTFFALTATAWHRWRPVEALGSGLLRGGSRAFGCASPRGVRAAQAALLPLAAALAFGFSSAAASRVGHTAHVAAFRHALAADLQAIRQRTAGRTVCLPALAQTWYDSVNVFFYYLAGSYIDHGDPYCLRRRATFLLAPVKAEGEALLTPDNRFMHLYQREALSESPYATAYRNVRAGIPAARSRFDLFLVDRVLTYVREPCAPADLEERIFLRVFPVQRDDLPAARQARGFDNLGGFFRERRILFAEQCLLSMPLPAYPVAGIETGQAFAQGADRWQVAFPVVKGNPLVGRAFRALYRTVVSRSPAVRATFDVYADEAAGWVTWVKEPCVRRDVEPRFFLHVFPRDAADLPPARQPLGFDSLTFDFDLHGAAWEGACLARAQLPAYAAQRIRVGQWLPDEGREVWSGTIATRAMEAAFQAATSGAPAARAHFDVYRVEPGVALLKEACTDADTEPNFFLHVIPRRRWALPAARRALGFDSYGFRFEERGRRFAGQCLVLLPPLPDYRIRRLRIGQWLPAEERTLWQVEIPGE